MLHELDSSGAAAGFGRSHQPDELVRPTARKAARAGRRAEFERYYRATYPRLLAQQHAILGDREQALSTTRDAFIHAWLQWKSVRTLPDAASWVRQAAKRAANPYRRAAANIEPSAGMNPSSFAVFAALHQLPLVQRRAVVLRHMAGLASEQLAHEERASVQTINNRLAHGQWTLAHRLGAGSTSHSADELGWTAEWIDNWVAREMAYLVYALTPTTDMQPAATVFQGALWRQRTTGAVAAAVVLVGGVGASLANSLSNISADGAGFPPLASRGPASTGPAQLGPDQGSMPGRGPGSTPVPGLVEPQGPGASFGSPPATPSVRQAMLLPALYPARPAAMEKDADGSSGDRSWPGSRGNDSHGGQGDWHESSGGGRLDSVDRSDPEHYFSWERPRWFVPSHWQRPPTAPPTTAPPANWPPTAPPANSPAKPPTAPPANSPAKPPTAPPANSPARPPVAAPPADAAPPAYATKPGSSGQPGRNQADAARPSGARQSEGNRESGGRQQSAGGQSGTGQPNASSRSSSDGPSSQYRRGGQDRQRAQGGQRERTAPSSQRERSGASRPDGGAHSGNERSHATGSGSRASKGGGSYSGGNRGGAGGSRGGGGSHSDGGSGRGR
jgi:DNA-directed RNA polymerase specialized sigma24 family protein